MIDRQKVIMLYYPLCGSINKIYQVNLIFKKSFRGIVRKSRNNPPTLIAQKHMTWLDGSLIYLKDNQISQRRDFKSQINNI